MARASDFSLAMSVAAWLASNKCTVSVMRFKDRMEVNYTLRDDIKPQPAIKVKDGRISIPAGSQQAVVAAFLGQFK